MVLGVNGNVGSARTWTIIVLKLEVEISLMLQMWFCKFLCFLWKFALQSSQWF